MDTKLNSAPRVDELRLQRIKKHAVQNGSWEGMCFALNTIVQEEGQEPYAPLVAVWADVESGMILDHATDRPENGPGILQTSLIRAMEDSGTIPEYVGVHTSVASRIVQPVASQLDIAVSIMDELPAVEAAVHWLQTCTAPAVDNRSADDTDGEKKDLLLQVENANYELLALFESWLSAQGLQQSTRVRHLKTVDLFLNSYLMDIGPMAPDEGIFKLDQFFGRWLPKAVPWLSESAVQGMVPGLKKFAVCLHQQGLLAQEDLQDFLAMIKARRKSWEQAGNGD
ncbi:DUF6930 domain-containing protein [Desulfovermiculus halophilus]|uniref:DUF6930 domain-containing protein n=1 Tax=Desulfovermiculus halophilus TaxID=339722 RepID=UPI000684A4DB|nr:hypothetical protein [Desulfovermiculus halophilus]